MPAESHREGGRSGEGGNYVNLDHLHGHGHHERAEDAGLEAETRRFSGSGQDPTAAPQPPMLPTNTSLRPCGATAPRGRLRVG